MRTLARGMRWLLVATALAVGTAIAVPYLVPVASFIPEITQRASASLGQPVTIADLRMHLLPTPRLVAERVRIGRKDEVAIGTLEIVPELLSFLVGPRTIRLLRAEQVELNEAALSIPDRMPKGGEPLEMRRLILRDVRLQHSALKLPTFNVDARMGQGLEVEMARIDTSDSTLTLLVDPDGAGRTVVKLEGRRADGAGQGTAALGHAGRERQIFGDGEISRPAGRRAGGRRPV